MAEEHDEDAQPWVAPGFDEEPWTPLRILTELRAERRHHASWAACAHGGANVCHHKGKHTLKDLYPASRRLVEQAWAEQHMKALWSELTPAQQAKCEGKFLCPASAACSFSGLLLNSVYFEPEDFPMAEYEARMFDTACKCATCVALSEEKALKDAAAEAEVISLREDVS